MGYALHNGRVWIVTEFIDGGDLHLLLKTHSIELPWNLRIAMACDVGTPLVQAIDHGEYIRLERLRIVCMKIVV
jgi:serine/threonine protein kinase